MLLSWLVATVLAELEEAEARSVLDHAMLYAHDPALAPPRVQAAHEKLVAGRMSVTGPGRAAPAVDGRGRGG